MSHSTTSGASRSLCAHGTRPRGRRRCRGHAAQSGAQSRSRARAAGPSAEAVARSSNGKNELRTSIAFFTCANAFGGHCCEIRLLQELARRAGQRRMRADASSSSTWVSRRQGGFGGSSAWARRAGRSGGILLAGASLDARQQQPRRRFHSNSRVSPEEMEGLIEQRSCCSRRTRKHRGKGVSKSSRLVRGRCFEGAQSHRSLVGGPTGKAGAPQHAREIRLRTRPGAGKWAGCAWRSFAPPGSGGPATASSRLASPRAVAALAADKACRYRPDT